MTNEWNPYDAPESIAPETTTVSAVQARVRSSMYTAIMPFSFSVIALVHSQDHSVFHPLTLTATAAAIVSTVYSARTILKNRT